VRNPVAMIASSLATASDPSTNPLEREEMFALAAREARRLENLTSDLLTYARPSQPQRTLFPIADILNHVVNMTKVRSGERSIAVSCEPCDDLRVEIDPSQIESALVNLSLNALDATPDGGQIVFRIRTDESMVAIEVENSGDAISPDHILRIFEPFYTTKAHGTGLGLAIARTVARSHGGDLWVSQNRAGIVTFTMSLLVHASQDESGEAVYGQGVDR
jgi:signal transduction histidine kinase